ncbi:MAG: hypothetical protein ACLU4N_05410 [Butyricimonas faecihominis]
MVWKYQFSGVEINGFASLRGLELNTRLGQKRRNACRVYPKPDAGLDEYDFILINGVENWDGLRRLRRPGRECKKRFYGCWISRWNRVVNVS